MDRADVAALANALREAFLADGGEMRERKTVTGEAFLLGEHAVGQIDVRANVVRARLWLSDEDRRRFEARPTFDPESGWLHVVSDEDVELVRSLIPAASRTAASGADAAPPAPRSVDAAPPRAAPTKRRRAAPAALPSHSRRARD
ncbi:MAG: hypothetical protein KGJ98_01900 [Chloroflexota bacterium]|nr:hypothetical protein [Chloroflexota bacterium]